MFSLSYLWAELTRLRRETLALQNVEIAGGRTASCGTGAYRRAS